MKALSFFTLLNEAYRLTADEMKRDILISDMPHLNQNDRSRVISQIERASDVIIPLEQSDDYSGLEMLKQQL